MTPCNDRWREQLADHILGSPASGELNEHLEECADCSATLREWSARMGRIDAGIRQMGASEPPAHSSRHIMAQVHVWRQRAWWPGWKWQTAAMCGLVIAGASLAYVSLTQERARNALAAASAIGHWRSPTEGLLESPADRWLKTPPELGKHFYYQLDSNVHRKERENP